MQTRTQLYVLTEVIYIYYKSLSQATGRWPKPLFTFTFVFFSFFYKRHQLHLRQSEPKLAFVEQRERVVIGQIFFKLILLISLRLQLVANFKKGRRNWGIKLSGVETVDGNLQHIRCQAETLHLQYLTIFFKWTPNLIILQCHTKVAKTGWSTRDLLDFFLMNRERKTVLDIQGFQQLDSRRHNSLIVLFIFRSPLGASWRYSFTNNDQPHSILKLKNKNANVITSVLVNI